MQMARIEDYQPYMESIRAAEVLRFLSPQELDRLLKVASIVRFAPDENIIIQGDIGQHFFTVISGSVDVTTQEFGDQSYVLSHLKAGDMFGEAAIFLHEERTATVTAAEETVILRIDRKDMMDYIRENPEAGNKILMVIILSLLAKLKAVNQKFVYQKQSEVDYSYVDSLVEKFITKD
jgi:CRP-like cAMP-binding protein